jgi:hypothetical protein
MIKNNKTKDSFFQNHSEILDTSWIRKEKNQLITTEKKDLILIIFEVSNELVLIKKNQKQSCFRRFKK